MPKQGGQVSCLLLNVLCVKFPVGQALSPLLQSRREREEKENVTEAECLSRREQGCSIVRKQAGGATGCGQKEGGPHLWTGGEGEGKEAPEADRARRSPAQSFPPPVAAAATPQTEPELRGRGEAGRQDGETPPAAGQTELWVSRVCSRPGHQRLFALAPGALAQSPLPGGAGRGGKSGFLPHEPCPSPRPAGCSGGLGRGVHTGPLGG